MTFVRKISIEKVFVIVGNGREQRLTTKTKLLEICLSIHEGLKQHQLYTFCVVGRHLPQPRVEKSMVMGVFDQFSKALT